MVLGQHIVQAFGDGGQVLLGGPLGRQNRGLALQTQAHLQEFCEAGLVAMPIDQGRQGIFIFLAGRRAHKSALTLAMLHQSQVH